MKPIEKVLNFGIGLILLNNLYLLSGLTRIPNLLLIGFSLVVSIYFTFRRWNTERVVFLLNNWYTILCVFFSLLLFSFDYLIYESEVKTNDMVRIVWYAFYFSWTYLLYTEQSELLARLKSLALWSIIILVLQGLFEYYQPYLWTFMLSSNVEKRTVGRIAGSLIDSNSYACSLILFFLIYAKEHFSKGNMVRLVYLVFLFFVVLYFNELSGSRQGALIILLFLGGLFFAKISFKNVKRLGIAIGLIFLLGLIFNEPIKEYANENPHSAMGRFLSDSDNKSSQSNLDRQNSIYQGIIFLSDGYFLLGPGMLNFASRWAASSDAHEPHIGFLFLWVQYGILAFVIFYIYYLSFLRAKKAQLNSIYFGLFIHIALQPNTVYYAIIFFVFFYIDMKYKESINLPPAEVVEGDIALDK